MRRAVRAGVSLPPGRETRARTARRFIVRRGRERAHG